MIISKPVHSEARTIWYVLDVDTRADQVADDIVATLEIGQIWDSGSGASYRLLGVNVGEPNRLNGYTGGNGYVLLERIDRGYSDRYTWRVESLLADGLLRQPRQRAYSDD